MLDACLILAEHRDPDESSVPDEPRPPTSRLDEHDHRRDEREHHQKFTIHRQRIDVELCRGEHHPAQRREEWRVWMTVGIATAHETREEHAGPPHDDDQQGMKNEHTVM